MRTVERKAQQTAAMTDLWKVVPMVVMLDRWKAARKAEQTVARMAVLKVVWMVRTREAQKDVRKVDWKEKRLAHQLGRAWELLWE